VLDSVGGMMNGGHIELLTGDGRVIAAIDHIDEKLGQGYAKQHP
jgi:hypothetical protein